MKKAIWLLLCLGVFLLWGVARLHPQSRPAQDAIRRAKKLETIAEKIQNLGAGRADGPIRFGANGPRVALHVEDRGLHGDWQGPSITRVYDLDTGNALPPLLKHDESISLCCINPDGKALLTLPGYLDSKKMARVWDLETGKQVLALKPEQDDHLREGCFSRDGDRILATAEGKAIGDGHRMASYVWDAKTGSLIDRVQHPDDVKALAFSPDGEYVLATSRKAASVRARQTGKHVTLAPTEGYWFSGTYMGKGQSFSHDGFHQHAITIEENEFNQHIVRVWNVNTGAATVRVKCEDQGSVSALALSPDERRLALATEVQGVILLDVEKPQSVTKCKTARGGVLSLDFAPDGERLAVTECENVEVVDTHDGTVVAGPLGFQHKWKHRDSITEKWLSKAAFSPDGRWLVLVDRAGYAGIWNAQTGKEIRRVRAALE